MEKDDIGAPKEIIAARSQTIVHKSAGLVKRALRDLSAADVATFVELGKALTSSLQLDQILRVVMDKMEELLRPRTWYLLLLDELTEELYFELAVGKNSEKLKDVHVKLGEGIAGWVAENSEALVLADAQNDARFLRKVDGWPGIDTHSIVAVPVQFQGRCLGVIGLFNYFGSEEFSQADLSLLRAFADFSAIALENARHVKSLHQLTITDELTGLYNARHLGFILDMEVCRSQRYGYEFSLICTDLDDLEDLKKSLSYAHFRQLLSELGQAFKAELRLIDFGFCFSEGEFMVLLPQTAKKRGRLIARRLHKFFREALWLREAGRNIRLRARVGLAVFPEDGKTKGDLFHAMDEAMFLLKKSSTDGVVDAKNGILSSL